MPDCSVLGLVLPAVPGYSETFFRNKIMGLQKNGIEVKLFAVGPSKDFVLCPYLPQPPVHGLLPFAWIKTLQCLIHAVFKRPKVLKRLYDLERTQGNTMVQAFKTILANTHILQQRLDWLHFGFATMALGRENLAKAMGAKMAVSLRGFDIAIYPLKHPGCYQRMWSRIDKLHVISDDLKDLAIKDGLMPNTQVEKITPAIDIDHFHTSRKFNVPLSQPLKLLTVARLHWKKGLEDTLRALSLLKSKNIAFEYTIIGEGDEYERLVFAAHQLGIREHVHFAGKKSPTAVKQAMEECDIYLQYSISEGFCNAVLEAQAMGCLCVVSDAEGLPENVIHGVTGWVVPKRDPEVLANTIAQITQLSSEELFQIREYAIHRVKENFSLDNQIQQFVQFYQAS